MAVKLETIPRRTLWRMKTIQLCIMIMCLICRILKLQEWARYQLLSPQEWKWRTPKSPKTSLKAPTGTLILGSSRNPKMTPMSVIPRAVQQMSQPWRRHLKTLHPHAKEWLPVMPGQERLLRSIFLP